MDKLNYSSETVNRYILECIDAVDTAREKGVKFVDMDPLVALKGFTDLGNAHLMMTAMAKHSCKSRFIPGVIVGFGGATVLGMYMARKDARKKNTP